MYYNKEVRVRLVGDAKKAHTMLMESHQRDEAPVFEAFNRIKEILKENPMYGDPVPRGLYPKNYKKLKLQNLYRVELANRWRMMYTIEGNTVEILVFVLDICNHKDYNSLFHYD